MLVLLPTFALVLGFVDLGIMMFRWTTLQNAVREGCRYAITFQTQTGMGQDASIKAVVEQMSLGIVHANDNPQHIFVNYYAPTNLNTPIGTGGNTPGNIVEVSVSNLSLSFIAPFSGTIAAPFYNTAGYSLRVTSADMLGGYPAGVTSVSR